MNIKDAIVAIKAVEEHSKTVDKFAREQYYLKFPRDTCRVACEFHAYNGFNVLSESSIEVKYVYGAGDIEYNDSFLISII